MNPLNVPIALSNRAFLLVSQIVIGMARSGYANTFGRITQNTISQQKQESVYEMRYHNAKINSLISKLNVGRSELPTLLNENTKSEET